MAGVRMWVMGMAVVAAAGCAERVVPVIRPLLAERSKPGGPYQTLVVLPRNAVASVYLHFVVATGRVSISRVGVVNHDPDKVTVFATQTRVYVDDGPPLQILDYTEMDAAKSNRDHQVLKALPPGAKGTWLFPKGRILTQKSIRGPVVVLLYSADGHDGAVKVPYRVIWAMP